MRIQRYNVAQAFNISDAPASLEVLGYFDENHPLIPKRDDKYVFEWATLRDLLAFLTDPSGDAFYLCGPTGCGKTSIVTQAANRLRWPTTSMTCHGRIQVMDMIGRMVLVGNDQGQAVMKYVKGPLAEALEKGYLFILNEMDLMDPSEVAGLNDILEGASLTIPETGEVIKPHPEFRFVATANSNGAGDTTGGYQGVLQQNIAAMDRFRMTQVDYLVPEVEKDILHRAVPQMAQAGPLAEKMIAVANRIRKAFSDTEGAVDTHLSITMSTRTLIRWARLTQVYQGAPNALHYALERALLFRSEPAQAEAILRWAQDEFGQNWNSEGAA
ncbi:AAA family ATPase [Endozoicomonas sp. ALC066]|uniref:AAA family ATPase n=1 Tax=Endozoicomonas sp. ALC066 TaxID=3403078 RepID=UPI003BB5C7C1